MSNVNVHAIESFVLVTDEMIVDFGIGTAEEQAAAAERLDARRSEMAAYWCALPRRTRLVRRLAPRWYEIRYRCSHALAALRGIECEG